jgi:hypothetical protein
MGKCAGNKQMNEWPMQWPMGMGNVLLGAPTNRVFGPSPAVVPGNGSAHQMVAGHIRVQREVGVAIVFLRAGNVQLDGWEFTINMMGQWSMPLGKVMAHCPLMADGIPN